MKSHILNDYLFNFNVVFRHKRGGFIMIKKLFIALIMSCFMVGSAYAIGTINFDDMYDKDPLCFMTLDYYDLDSPGTAMKVVQGDFTYKYGRSYYQEDGELWDSKSRTKDVVAPCCITGTVPPSWICPEAVAVVITPATAVYKEQKTFVVYFDFDKSNLTNESIAILNEAVTYAKDGGFSAIALASFCDFRGTEQYNIELGQRRLDSVYSWFDTNVEGFDFELTNYGESLSPVRDLVNGFCGECWTDRRVEIDIK